jgi:DNA polymerase III delta subunit
MNAGMLIIVNGDDEFLKERAALDEISMSLSIRVRSFKFPNSIEEYTEMLDMSSFNQDDCTVVIWNAVEVPKILDGRTTIIVSAKGKNLNSIHAKRVVNVKKPKPYDDGAEYIRWIMKEGERLNIGLRRVASALFVNCGTDLRKTCSEIAKIKALVGPANEVDPSVVRQVMCFSAALTPKSVVDAICEGHPSKAIAFYDKLQEGGCETGWIISYMQCHVLLHLRAKMLIKADRSIDQVSAILDLHPTFFRNTVVPRLDLWDSSSLRQSLDILCDLDLRNKRGVDVSRWGLETEIIRLSEEAKQNVESRGSRTLQSG